MESILSSIKKLIGIDESYTHFDSDLIMHINSVLMVLTQLGVGPATGFTISGYSETWSEFLGANESQLAAVRSYVHLKVKLLFDPPQNSAALESTNNLIREFEWRLNVAVDPGKSQSEVSN